jgi:hypothetical protein
MWRPTDRASTDHALHSPKGQPMAYLVAALFLVGLLCAIDLLLTLAVIRRLREHEQRFVGLSGAAVAFQPAVDRVPEFTATTVDGRTVCGPDLRGAVVAFFSTDCVACEPEVPKFVRYLAEEGYERKQVLAVVAGVDTPEAKRIVDQLHEIAEVVREPFDGTVCTAFANSRFPTYYLVAEGGDIETGAPHVAGLPHRMRT